MAEDLVGIKRGDLIKIYCMKNYFNKIIKRRKMAKIMFNNMKDMNKYLNKNCEKS